MRRLPTGDYSRLFELSVPDISRADNQALARSARDLAECLATVRSGWSGQSRTFDRLLLKLVFRFAGAPQDERVLDQVLEELDGPGEAASAQAASTGLAQQAAPRACGL